MTAKALARAACLALAAALAVVVLIAVASGGSRSGTLNRESSQISGLQQQLAQARRAAAAAENRDTLAALGVQSTRIASDSTLISGLITTAFTWKSGAQYSAARTALEQQYKISGKSQFMESLLPPPAYSTDEDGHRYYYIDAIGAASTLDSVTPELTGVSGTSYRYAVLARIDVSDTSVPGSKAVREVLVYLTVSGAGQISDASGIAASSATDYSS